MLPAVQANAAKLDPTRPFGHKQSSPIIDNGKKMVLESIIKGNEIETVIISGKLMKKSDYIGEYQLTSVNNNSVILDSETDRIELNIFKSNLVKTSVDK